MHDNKSPLPSRRQILKGAGLAAGTAATVALSGAKRAVAAGYPDRPIKIVVPFAPAGPTDIMARVLGQNLGAALPGSVIVENRSGAGGNLGIGYTAHAEADGYTLLVTSSAYVVNPSLYATIPYNPFKDFTPIAELGTIAECDHDRSQARHQFNCRVDRAGQGEARRIELFQPRRRHYATFIRRIAEDRRRQSRSRMFRLPAPGLRSRRSLAAPPSSR